MKKRCTVLLVLLLCLCSALPALAEETEPTPNPAPTDIPIYSVEVIWGVTEFTYQAIGTWNPKTLSYEGSGDWLPDFGSVTVENNSNVPVVATLVANIDSIATGIEILLQGETVRTVDVDASESFFYSLRNAPNNTLENSVIATLTITITASEGETP